MNKTNLLFCAALLTLLSCRKEGQETFLSSEASAKEITFNIDVDHLQGGGDTKAVKTCWEDGDIIYVFFEENTTQYLKMTYDGQVWQFADKDGGTSFAGLVLGKGSQRLSAVWFPSYVNSEPPYLYEGVFRFNAKQGYYLAAENVGYSFSSTANATIVRASLEMRLPEGAVQIYQYMQYVINPNLEKKLALVVSGLSPFCCGDVVPGGSVGINTGGSGMALTGLGATVAGEAGYYFYGILDQERRGVSCDYDMQFVKLDPDHGVAVQSYTRTVTAKLLDNAGKGTVRTNAIKMPLPPYDLKWARQGTFVDLGVTNSYDEYNWLWATGNLSGNNIAGPFEAGDFYKPGRATPYDFSGERDPWDEYARDSYYFDPARTAQSEWSTPHESHFSSLLEQCNWTWKDGWTSLGGAGGGFLVTSKANGLSIFLPAAGAANEGVVYWAGNFGAYIIQTHLLYTEIALFFELSPVEPKIDTNHRTNGGTVRPVKKKSENNETPLEPILP